MPAAVAICVTIKPVEVELPYTTSVLPKAGLRRREGYGRPRAGVETPGIAVPGSLSDQAQDRCFEGEGDDDTVREGDLVRQMAASVAAMTV
jgi:hypothetical protein